MQTRVVTSTGDRILSGVVPKWRMGAEPDEVSEAREQRVWGGPRVVRGMLSRKRWLDGSRALMAISTGCGCLLDQRDGQRVGDRGTAAHRGPGARGVRFPSVRAGGHLGHRQRCDRATTRHVRRVSTQAPPSTSPRTCFVLRRSEAFCSRPRSARSQFMQLCTVGVIQTRATSCSGRPVALTSRHWFPPGSGWTRTVGSKPPSGQPPVRDRSSVGSRSPGWAQPRPSSSMR